MRSRRILIVAFTAAAALMTMDSPAAGEGRGGDAYIDDAGNPTAEARDSGDRPRSSRSSGSNDCEWRVVNEDDTFFAIYDESGNRLHSDTGRWLERWCGGQQVLVGDSYAVPESRRSVDPAALAQQARESVPIPSPPIATSPEAERRLYTRVQTWLWIPEGWWHGYSATAEAGGVSTTVSATPVRAVWSMGDGGRVVCEGPGVEWRQGMSDDETYCSYVYKNASSTQDDGTYTITLTVEFALSWTSNVGSGGALPPITRSASRDVEVGEIQAVETG